MDTYSIRMQIEMAMLIRLKIKLMPKSKLRLKERHVQRELTRAGPAQ